jgi:hypothetical protein
MNQCNCTGDDINGSHAAAVPLSVQHRKLTEKNFRPYVKTIFTVVKQEWRSSFPKPSLKSCVHLQHTLTCGVNYVVYYVCVISGYVTLLSLLCIWVPFWIGTSCTTEVHTLQIFDIDYVIPLDSILHFSIFLVFPGHKVMIL